MKKILPLSLLAVSAAYMSAATPPFEVSLESATPVEVESIHVRTASKAFKPILNSIKATDYSSETWALLGDGKYASQAIAGCYGGSTDLVDVVVYEAEGKAGLYKVEGVWSDIIEGGGSVLYVDASDPEFVVVEEQYTGLIDNVDGETYIASYSWEALSNGNDKDYVLENTPEFNAYVKDGVVYFPAGSLGLRWPEAPDDSQYGTDPSLWYYDYSSTEGMLVLPGANYVDPWGEAVAVEGVMVENILAETFQVQPSTYTVQVKKNFDTDTYRVIDAFRGFYDQIGGTGIKSPSMDIDASDPTNASVPEFSTGVGYDLMSYSYYASYYADSQVPEEYKITVIEEGENTVITFPVQSMLLSNGSNLYYASKGVSTITFPTIKKDDAGIADIIVDNDAKVEYFNLQGIRVENPKAGQIVIKRQGSVVTKEFIR